MASKKSRRQYGASDTGWYSSFDAAVKAYRKSGNDKKEFSSIHLRDGGIIIDTVASFSRGVLYGRDGEIIDVARIRRAPSARRRVPNPDTAALRRAAAHSNSVRNIELKDAILSTKQSPRHCANDPDVKFALYDAEGQDNNASSAASVGDFGYFCEHVADFYAAMSQWASAMKKCHTKPASGPGVFSLYDMDAAQRYFTTTAAKYGQESDRWRKRIANFKR